jgi:hypothetical protein
MAEANRVRPSRSAIINEIGPACPRCGRPGGGAPPIFLDTREAAVFLRISPITLARWRIEGKGPAYRKFGRCVVYARADLTAWSDAQRRQSTSDVGRKDHAITATKLRSTEWYRKYGWR